MHIYYGDKDFLIVWVQHIQCNELVTCLNDKLTKAPFSWMFIFMAECVHMSYLPIRLLSHCTAAQWTRMRNWQPRKTLRRNTPFESVLIPHFTLGSSLEPHTVVLHTVYKGKCKEDWQQQPILLLFCQGFPLLYVSVENFLMLKGVVNNFQIKDEWVCAYIQLLSISPKAHLWNGVIFLHHLSVYILISVVF